MDEKPKAVDRVNISVTQTHLDLLERLTRLRLQHRRAVPKRSALLKQALLVGLRVLVQEESADLQEQQEQQEKLQEAKALHKLQRTR